MNCDEYIKQKIVIELPVNNKEDDLRWVLNLAMIRWVLNLAMIFLQHLINTFKK